MTRRIGMIFPGQGSQTIGMLGELAAAHPVIKETFAEASDALDLDLWQIASEGPEEVLNQTQNTQPVMLAGGIALYRAWRAAGGATPEMVAGHSLGEYSALVAAEAVDFADAIKLVSARGQFMQEAVPEGSGAMAAILGLEDQQVRDVCAQASEGDSIAEAVNFNSPGQVVVAGEASAVARAADQAKAAGAKRAIMLPVSVPSHCSLMKPASEKLQARLAEVAVTMPTIPVLHNVDVSSAGSPEEIRDKLVAQLHQPVRWSETIIAMRDAGLELLFECGPGKVLMGLNRKIDRSLTSISLSDPAGFNKALEELA
ncbi:MAG: ACP S-malonyltransferase [bacterium]